MGKKKKIEKKLQNSGIVKDSGKKKIWYLRSRYLQSSSREKNEFHFK